MILRTILGWAGLLLFCAAVLACLAIPTAKKEETEDEMAHSSVSVNVYEDGWRMTQYREYLDVGKFTLFRYDGAVLEGDIENCTLLEGDKMLYRLQNVLLDGKEIFPGATVEFSVDLDLEVEE